MDSAELNLQLLTSRMILVSLVFLIVTGSFGSVCNIIIFSSKDLKNNPCALYLLCTAVFELLILNFGIISRLASDNFGSTLLFQSTIYCKTRSYLTTAISVTATYLVLLACVDRCMSTSTNVRQRAFSRVQVARWSAATTIVIGMIINFHSFIFFEIKIVCLPRPGVYALFYSIYLIVCASVVPNVLMIVCSAGTIRNLRKARLRIANAQLTGSSQQRRLKRLEDQLILIMLALAFSSIVVDAVRLSLFTYYFLTIETPKSRYAALLGTFFFQLSNILTYVNYAKSFYLCTLTSVLYRKIFVATMLKYHRRAVALVKGDSLGRVHPMNTQ